MMSVSVGLASRESAGLVEHDDVQFVGPLQSFAGTDEDAVLRPLACADHDGGGRRQAHGTGTGDDHHRTRRHEQGERDARLRAKEVPDEEREHGDTEHHRHEDAGDVVGQPLDGRLRSLRLFHQPDDLGEGGVAADLGGAEVEGTGAVDAWRL